MSVNPAAVAPSIEYVLVPATPWSGGTCTCDGVGTGLATTTLRGQRLVRLVHLDRAAAAAQVTVAEAAERRVEVLGR